MDWISLITAIAGLVAGGGIVGIFTLKASRRKADAEASDAAVEPLKRAIDILNQQYQTAIETVKAKETCILEQQEKIQMLTNRLIALYDDMCVHKGCKLRKPHQGQGQRWYEDHSDDASLGCDFLSVETLLRKWRQSNSDSDGGSDD